MQGIPIKKAIFLALVFKTSFSYADISLSAGEAITIRGERISCSGGEPALSTRCFCDSSGCATAYTSKGNVVLNIVTTDSTRSSRTKCIEYDTESSCLQAMSACNSYRSSLPL